MRCRLLFVNAPRLGDMAYWPFPVFIVAVTYEIFTLHYVYPVKFFNLLHLFAVQYVLLKRAVWKHT